MSCDRRLTRSAAKAGQIKTDAALIAAAKVGDIAAATAALDAGGDMNRPTPFFGPNEACDVPVELRAETPHAEGYTAFMYAADNGHLNIVTLFLDRGCDPNAANGSQRVYVDLGAAVD